MEEVTTPSPAGSETQTAGTPETGNPNASHGATPERQAATTSLEEAMRKIADLEKTHNNAKEELERHRKNAKKLADYEKAEQERRDAALSEVEKANKRAQDAEAKIQQYQKQLVTAQVKMAAHNKGIIDPDIAALAIQNDLELDENGLPTNIDTALDKLIKSKPYLVPAKADEPKPDAQHTAPPPQQQQEQRQAPNLPPFSGRSAIPTPTPSSQGTFVPPAWSDAFPRR